jgi:hypothetical protein
MDLGAWRFMTEYETQIIRQIRPSDNKCPKKSKLVDELWEQVKQPAPEHPKPSKAERCE